MQSYFVAKLFIYYTFVLPFWLFCLCKMTAHMSATKWMRPTFASFLFFFLFSSNETDRRHLISVNNFLDYIISKRNELKEREEIKSKDFQNERKLKFLRIEKNSGNKLAPDVNCCKWQIKINEIKHEKMKEKYAKHTMEWMKIHSIESWQFFLLQRLFCTRLFLVKFIGINE